VRYPAGVDTVPHIDAGDRAFVQIVDAAVAEAARRSGPWLVCRPGCTQCCIGPFPITPLDARRLRLGLAELERRDPDGAGRVRERARASWSRVAHAFPGDTETGVLSEPSADGGRFDTFADDEPCPALDTQTGTCDLYAARPVTCRIFGPPVRCDGALGVCELCYEGASEAEIASCQVDIDPAGLEGALLADLEKVETARGETIVAFCLSR